jgi:hypothetical protein
VVFGVFLSKSGGLGACGVGWNVGCGSWIGRDVEWDSTEGIVYIGGYSESQWSVGAVAKVGVDGGCIGTEFEIDFGDGSVLCGETDYWRNGRMKEPLNDGVTIFRHDDGVQGHRPHAKEQVVTTVNKTNALLRC